MMNQIQEQATRSVFCADAKEWLEQNKISSGSSVVASLPDISEFPSYSLDQWKNWFIETARLILSKTPDDGVTVFYQSDIKVEGEWVDKGYLCLKAAELERSSLLWHKVACTVQAGQTSFGRAGYSHILCFSRTLKADVSKSSADVIPETGEKIWPRGTGLNAALMIANFIAQQTHSHTVVNPFCGQGSLLAAANALGLSAIGIERSPKRVEAALQLRLDLSTKNWLM